MKQRDEGEEEKYGKFTQMKIQRKLNTKKESRGVFTLVRFIKLQAFLDPGPI